MFSVKNSFPKHFFSIDNHHVQNFDFESPAAAPHRRAAELWHIALKFPLKMREDETHQTSQEDESDKSSFFLFFKAYYFHINFSYSILNKHKRLVIFFWCL